MKLVPKFVSKMFRVGTAPEGQPVPTFGIGEFGNVFSIPFGNGWERGLNGSEPGSNGTVMSVIMVLARVLSAAYPNHVRINDKGGRNIVTTSAAHRLLMRPNAAQNPMDFISTTILALCIYGNSYYYIRRNDRNEPIALIPLSPRQHRAYFSDDYSAVFYDVSDDFKFAALGNLDYMVPARDILHFKLPSRNSVLHGDSPLTYAAAAAAVNSAIMASSAAFLHNMSRPSGVLSTELPLTGTQMKELRAKFNEASAGAAQGQVPILGGGLKWQSMSITANDAQILETYNVSVLDICRVFGVPIQLLGQETNGAASSVATLIGQFKAGSLLYMAELIEFGLEEIFNFDHNINTVRFDLDNVSRADFATEIDTLSKGIQNAIFSPDEARNRVGLDAVPFGDSPRIQAQNVMLEYAVPAPSAPSAGKGSTSTAPEEDDDAGLSVDEDVDEDAVSKHLALLIKGYSTHE